MTDDDAQRMVVNTIIEWTDGPEPRYDRILKIDSRRATIVVIDVTYINNDATVRPVLLLFDVIEEAFRTSKACVSDRDPYLEMLRPRMALTDQEKIDLKKTLEIIEPIISNSDVFHPKALTTLIKNAAKDSCRDPKTIRVAVNRYWRGGGIEQVLLPRYYHCGTNRKKDKKKSYAKLGRRGDTAGVNMDPIAERHFRTGLKLFYFNEKGRSLRYAYEETKEKLFHKGKYEKHGAEIPQLPPSDEIPSYRQFVYFFKKSQDIGSYATSMTRNVVYWRVEHFFFGVTL